MSTRPLSLILTSPVKFISFQQDVKPIAQDYFSLMTTGVRIHIITHCMANYKALLEYNLHHFAFNPQFYKPIRAALPQLLINTFSQIVILACQELGCDVVNIKQIPKNVTHLTVQ
jgi:hypothetical protein